MCRNGSRVTGGVSGWLLTVGFGLQEGQLPALELLHVDFEATNAAREEVKEGGELIFVERRQRRAGSESRDACGRSEQDRLRFGGHLAEEETVGETRQFPLEGEEALANFGTHAADFDTVDPPADAQAFQADHTLASAAGFDGIGADETLEDGIALHTGALCAIVDLSKEDETEQFKREIDTIGGDKRHDFQVAPLRELACHLSNNARLRRLHMGEFPSRCFAPAGHHTEQSKGGSMIDLPLPHVDTPCLPGTLSQADTVSKGSTETVHGKSSEPTAQYLCWTDLLERYTTCTSASIVVANLDRRSLATRAHYERFVQIVVLLNYTMGHFSRSHQPNMRVFWT